MVRKEIVTSDFKIKSAKPSDKAYRLIIGENVYCEVLPSGRKVWRMRFLTPGTKKPAIYTFGCFDDSDRRDDNPNHISLKQVRRLADDAKHLVSRGIHPQRERERIKGVQDDAEGKAFEAIARQWWSVKEPEWEYKNARKILHGLEKDVFPVLGACQIDEITAPDVLRMLRKIENRGALDYMNRTKQRCRLIFSFAIGEGLAERNPVQDINGNLKKYQERNHNFLKSDQLPQFFRKLEKWENPIVRIAITLTVHVVLRTSEIRIATWDEIDYENRLWKVPADEMKMRNEHWIPLSNQVIELLRELEGYRMGDYLFMLGSRRKPMSDGTMLQALYGLGYKGVATMHGFRSTFSTISNDAGWPGDYVEAALAHKIQGVRGAYNHSVYLDQRRELMQWYSNSIDSLCAGGSISRIGTRTKP